MQQLRGHQAILHDELGRKAQHLTLCHIYFFLALWLYTVPWTYSQSKFEISVSLSVSVNVFGTGIGNIGHLSTLSYFIRIDIWHKYCYQEIIQTLLTVVCNKSFYVSFSSRLFLSLGELRHFLLSYMSIHCMINNIELPTCQLFIQRFMEILFLSIFSMVKTLAVWHATDTQMSD